MLKMNIIDLEYAISISIILQVWLLALVVF